MRIMSTTRLLVGSLIAVAAACASASAATMPPGAPVGSSKPRITRNAPAPDLHSLVASETQFGLDVLHALVSAAPSKSLVFSPTSVTAALAMAYGGSAGTTRDAFDRVLHQALPEPAFHRATNTLERLLASRGSTARGTGGQPFRLDVTNQLFAERRATFLPSYLDLLAQEYGAGARLLDFRSAPDAARVAINDWVLRKTAGHIQDLLAPGFVTPDTRGVLVNAIYFDAAWAKPFEGSQTRPAPFHLLDGGTATVEMMRSARIATQSATVDGVEVVSIPYDGHEVSLMILMPTSGSFADWERAVGADDIARYAAARRPEDLRLSMPRFTTRTSTSLSGTLKGLGLAVAFSDQADFSRMSRTERFLVTEVVHQAIIIVDERGTVAAAATGIGVGTTAMPPPARPVVIDRPFLYLIRDEATGAVLFLGRYVGAGA